MGLGQCFSIGGSQSFLGRPYLCQGTVLALNGSPNCVLWVAIYQLMRTTGQGHRAVWSTTNQSSFTSLEYLKSETKIEFTSVSKFYDLFWSKRISSHAFVIHRTHVTDELEEIKDDLETGDVLNVECLICKKQVTPPSDVTSPFEYVREHYMCHRKDLRTYIKKAVRDYFYDMVLSSLYNIFHLFAFTVVK